MFLNQSNFQSSLRNEAARRRLVPMKKECSSEDRGVGLLKQAEVGLVMTQLIRNVEISEQKSSPERSNTLAWNSDCCRQPDQQFSTTNLLGNTAELFLYEHFQTHKATISPAWWPWGDWCNSGCSKHWLDADPASCSRATGNRTRTSSKGIGWAHNRPFKRFSLRVCKRCGSDSGGGAHNQ